jgi:hypothetical protein
MYRTQRDDRKRAELAEAMKRLDALNGQEYLELAGGKIGKDQQLTGGEFKPRKGVGNWHESDTLKIMSLRYDYLTKKEWTGDEDRAVQADRTYVLRLARSLSAPHIQDLADFIEFSRGDPAVVESLRMQAANALIVGDVTELYVDTISEKYDIEAENRTHGRGFTYFFFNPEDNQLIASPPPGVTLDEVPSEARERTKAS